MPLLHRKPFVRQKPPADLDPHEEVFLCKITHEIFRNYDEFFERTILCNSLVWSCALTGRAGLTYLEAVESERRARSSLQNFPEVLLRPLLLLVKQSQSKRLSELCEDVYGFCRERYFPGENVDVSTRGGPGLRPRCVNVFQEREKLKEEKRKYAERLKQLSRPTEDLDCDDLQELPRPSPVQTRLPTHLFGEALMVLEFLRSFGEIFELKDEFPDGINLEVLEEALVGSDPEGPLCELLFFFLSAIFQSSDEDEERRPEQSDLSEALDDAPDSASSALAAMTMAAGAWSQLHQGRSLKHLDLDSCSLSEILRLKILSADAKDDPCAELRSMRPEILQKLRSTAVYDLQPGEKLQILNALVGKLLTLGLSRDLIEDCVDEQKTARSELREIRAEQHRREKEEAAYRVRMRREERLREQEQKMKEKEDKLREQENIRYRHKASSCTSLLPLGRDRWFRKYWLLPSQSALFVEEDTFGLTADMARPEVGVTECAQSTVCNGTILHLIAPRWWFFSSVDHLELLLQSLNPRGHRESGLREALLNERARITTVLQTCEESKYSHTGEPLTGEGGHECTTAESVMEAKLRDLLLDIEDRVYQGTLGSLKVPERQVWRVALEAGQYHTLINSCEDQLMEVDSDCLGASSVGSHSVRALAAALGQIERGIERRFLKPPLGEEDFKKEQKAKKNQASDDVSDSGRGSRSLLERWRESLSFCSSLSQVFVHLSTLERSVLWSRSLLNARCRICRRKGDADNMLLCDGCDRGHHTHCLRPKLKLIPSGDWFCPDCKPKQRSSRIPSRTRSSIDEEEEEEEETEDSEEEEETDDSEEEVEEEEEKEEEDSPPPR
uniref:Bromodomain adjacent to zinc finger domain protein 1A n=1 Tax=Periophthalmus magnuspinnatus TaxID=409849 RepID=A0A3B3ZKM0_9GOBI